MGVDRRAVGLDEEAERVLVPLTDRVEKPGTGALPGGFFLEQRARIDFIGQQVDALELIGYDPETDTFPSTVFSGFAPTPLPYRWDVRADRVTITVAYAGLDATFTGSWREDGTFSGRWRPNPGADESVNVPYHIAGRRLE